MQFTLHTAAGAAPIRLRHLGEYSVYNALAAAGVGCALGIDLDTIARGLEAAPPVPGRFELVEAGQDFVVAVDYAHKPDALERLIRSARKLAPERIITVVGCGGDRDRAKRPIMGRVATELSDQTILTSDNPRSEAPRAIIDDIASGARAVDPDGRRHVIEVDRAAAIRQAVGLARRGDILLIAGKGHETYQLIAGKRYDFDDRVHARDAILARRGRTPV
jgi:UDP-N-acetylmuramoyl-L-alanyl-D-glutamate--2,6-diaminopimelate ligase